MNKPGANRWELVFAQQTRRARLHVLTGFLVTNLLVVNNSITRFPLGNEGNDSLPVLRRLADLLVMQPSAGFGKAVETYRGVDSPKSRSTECAGGPREDMFKKAAEEFLVS